MSKPFSWLFLVIFLSSFCQKNHQSIPVFKNYYLNQMEPADRENTKKEIIEFYAQELFKAGCCSNQNAAHDAAQQEINHDSSCTSYFFYICAPHHQVPLGYLWYDIKNNEDPNCSAEVFIQALFLEKQYRRQGIARHIMGTLEAKLKAQGIHSIALYVFAHNQSAVKLYKNLDYTITSTYQNDGRIVGFSMKKDLHDC